VSQWRQLRSQAITFDQEAERELNTWKARNSTWSEERGIWIIKTPDQLPTHERCV